MARPHLPETFDYKEKTMSIVTEAKTGIEVGTILYTSWGYDQTNVEFYQVVKATKATVTIQRMTREWVESGDMRGLVVPGEVIPTSKPLVRRLTDSGCIRVDDYSRGWVYDGRPKYVSSYA